MPPPVLVTGAAGFIGFHAALQLLGRGEEVVGVDSFSDYYDVRLKEDRFAGLLARRGFHAERLDLADPEATRDLFGKHRPKRVLHLAAQPGVRRSLTQPMPYLASNVTAFLNVLEGCRHGEVEHLVYASSSSVYGANRKLPFAVDDPVDHPVSLYAATKRADELMAHAYAHLFGLPATGLRYFTVYGPWGRPDMAVFIFTDRIARGEPIEVAGGGTVRRDFTYVDDVVEGTLRILDRPPPPGTGVAGAPSRLYNIGNDSSEALDDLIGFIEAGLGRKAMRISVPLPPGDIPETRADIGDLRREIGFAPATPLREGVRRFVGWYRDRYG